MGLGSRRKAVRRIVVSRAGVDDNPINRMSGAVGTEGATRRCGRPDASERHPEFKHRSLLARPLPYRIEWLGAILDDRPPGPVISERA